MVDNLEEEHMRRDVFTTAIETTGQLNLSAAEGAAEAAALAGQAMGEPMSKPRAKAQDKFAAAAELALRKAGGGDDLAGGVIKRRGPRKKRDVVEQSDVPAAMSSRLRR